MRSENAIGNVILGGDVVEVEAVEVALMRIGQEEEGTEAGVRDEAVE